MKVGLNTKLAERLASSTCTTMSCGFNFGATSSKLAGVLGVGAASTIETNGPPIVATMFTGAIDSLGTSCEDPTCTGMDVLMVF